jgi:hypothetical protein
MSGGDIIPEAIVWPMLTNGQNHREFIASVELKKGNETIVYDLHNAVRINNKYVWFDGMGSVQWIFDEALEVINELKGVLPKEAVVAEKKYSTKPPGRNVTLRSALEKEFKEAATLTFSHKTSVLSDEGVPINVYFANLVRDFCKGPKPDWLLENEDQILCRVKEAVNNLLDELNVTKRKESQYWDAVRSCKPKNPQGSVAMSIKDGQRLTGTKADNLPLLVELGLLLAEKMKLAEQMGIERELRPEFFGIILVPRTRQDGGPFKPRLLFMSPATLYVLQKPILDWMSEYFKQDFEHFGYFPYSATTYLSHNPGTVVSSDYHRYDQSIPGVIIQLIIEEVCKRLGIPDYLAHGLSAIERYAPLVWAEENDLYVYKRDGLNPSGSGLFVMVNHIWAHVSQVVGIALVRNYLGPIKYVDPLKFGDDVLIVLSETPKRIKAITGCLEEVFKFLGVGWKTDAVSSCYALYLRNHKLLYRVGGIPVWFSIPLLMSRVRNLVFPERSEPQEWLSGDPGTASRINTAVALRAQMYGLAGIIRAYKMLSATHVAWGRAAKLLEVLYWKLFARLEIFMMPGEDDESLVERCDWRLADKLTPMGLQSELFSDDYDM